MACNSCNSCGNNTYGYRTTNVGGIWFPDFVANSCCNPCCAADVAGVSDDQDYVNRINGCGCVQNTCGCNQNCGCGCNQNNTCGCNQNNTCGCNQNNTCGCNRCRG